MPITGLQQPGRRIVALRPQFNPGDVAQAQHPAGTFGADDDVAELFGRNEPTFGGHGVDPVSYTHLDVYKRQPLNRPAIAGE